LRAFDYDDENQLIRVTVTNVFKSEFTYDGLRRRGGVGQNSSVTLRERGCRCGRHGS